MNPHRSVSLSVIIYNEENSDASVYGKSRYVGCKDLMMERRTTRPFYRREYYATRAICRLTFRAAGDVVALASREKQSVGTVEVRAHHISAATSFR